MKPTLQPGARRAEPPPLRLEHLLASLLHYGTWLASAVIALGLVLVMLDARWSAHAVALPAGMPIIKTGIGLFILLPVLRLVLMLGVFLRERDYRFGAIAALVLAIVCVACLLGAHMAAPLAG
jgi:uncharacterized membrane protein